LPLIHTFISFLIILQLLAILHNIISTVYFTPSHCAFLPIISTLVFIFFIFSLFHSVSDI